MGSSNQSIMLGDTQARIVPGIQQSLFNPGPILDDGSHLILDSSGGVIANRNNNKTIPISRDDRNMYRIWISDLKKYDSKGKEVMYTRDQYDRASWRAARAHDKSIVEERERLLAQAQSQSNASRAFFADVPTYHGYWSPQAAVFEEEDVPTSEGVMSEGVGLTVPSGWELHDGLWYIAGTSPKKTSMQLLHVAKVRRLYGYSAREEFERFHRAAGHPSLREIKRSFESPVSPWAGVKLSLAQCIRFAKEFHCSECALTKRRRRSTPVNEKRPEDLSLSEGDHRDKE
jgi:hypothetical protein